MAMDNSKMNAAREAKRDEFYTRLEDVESEMRHYRKHFKGKRVYCNCDDPETSQFVEFFRLQFKLLGLKSLTATGYGLKHMSARAEDFVLRPDYGVGWTMDAKGERIIETDGDCFSDLNRAILADSDIVVTNPPFSQFRRYIEMLADWGGGVLCMGEHECRVPSLGMGVLQGREDVARRIFGQQFLLVRCSRRLPASGRKLR